MAARYCVTDYNDTAGEVLAVNVACPSHRRVFKYTEYLRRTKSNPQVGDLIDVDFRVGLLGLSLQDREEETGK